MLAFLFVFFGTVFLKRVSGFFFETFFLGFLVSQLTSFPVTCPSDVLFEYLFNQVEWQLLFDSNHQKQSISLYSSNNF